jgi:RNA polymerase sigma factor (TIGR02999 family)
MTNVTQILNRIESGDESAAEQLLPLVYTELRKLARVRISNEKQGQTLQATALVHEAYLRLVDGDVAQHWNSRGHFFAAAAKAMRRILVERARQKKSHKRGGDLQKQEFSFNEILETERSVDLVALDEALDELAQANPSVAKVVELRYFAGLSATETAAAIGVSERTAQRYWVYAKAWLLQALQSH